MNPMRINVEQDKGLPSGEKFPLKNPEFIDLAPCPCDVTDSYCDIGCCCDEDCEGYQPRTCYEGPFGGVKLNLGEEFCNSRPSINEIIKLAGKLQSNPFNNTSIRRGIIYNLFTCLAAYNGAILGFDYPEVSIAEEKQDFDAILDSRSRKELNYRFDKDTGNRLMAKQLASTTTTYFQRDPVLLGSSTFNFEQTNPVLSKNRADNLMLLPNPKSCSNLEPVRYLENLEDYNCDIQLSRDTCSQFANLNSIPGILSSGISRLNALSFMLNEYSATRALCPPIFRVKTTKSEQAPELKTKTAYYCLNAQNIAEENHLGDSQLNPGSSVRVADVGFFTQNCQYDQSTKLTQCTPRTASTQTAITRCPWDNGYQLPTKPTLNQNTCQNVVLGVEYDLSWSSGEVKSIEAKVKLGNINVATAKTIRQKYRVSFHHNSISSTQQEPKSSGVYGYDENSKLITGTLRNQANGQFQEVIPTDETNKKLRPGVLLPVSAGLCETAEKSVPEFGANEQGSCLVYLRRNDFEDCDKLRSLIHTQINKLFSYDVVATYGSPSLNDLNDWNIVKRNEYKIPEPNTDGTIYFKDGLKNICSHIPHEIKLILFYAQQGKALGKTIHNILGARIDYGTTEWRLNCSSSLTNNACKPATNPVSIGQIAEPFKLHTKVLYVKVPPNWKEASRLRLSSYEFNAILRQTDLESCTTSDTCWEDLLYPLTRLDQDQLRMRLGITTGLILLTILITVALSVLKNTKK